VNEEVRLDVWLDAVAYVAAVHHDDDEGLRAVLAANWVCPVRLEEFIFALAALVESAVEGNPPGDVDEALAVLRGQLLEQR
jgi:hypothetical protein